MGETLFKSFPVTGVEDSGGDITVLGKCSDGELDSDGDIVSPSWMAQAVKTWMRVLPAVHLEHRKDWPAGRGVDAWQDEGGSTWVKSVIADDQAKDLVRSGKLRAYSIGIHDPETRKSARCPRWEIVGGRLTEISIVSAPANARCGVRVVEKSADGSPRFIGKAWGVDGRSAKAEKYLRKAARLLDVDVAELDAAAGVAGGPRRVLEKALRAEMRAALDSSDPWMRETARRVLSGQG